MFGIQGLMPILDDSEVDQMRCNLALIEQPIRLADLYD